jgi:hypothetical protein
MRSVLISQLEIEESVCDFARERLYSEFSKRRGHDNLWDFFQDYTGIEAKVNAT